MARTNTFSMLYLAGMAALMLVAVLAGSILTDDREADLGTSLWIGTLVLGAVLFVVAGIGARSSPGAAWPMACAVAAIVLVAVLAFLTLSTSGFAFDLLYEMGALVIGFLLVQEIRKV